MPLVAGLRDAVHAWLSADPDADDRAELAALLVAADSDGAPSAAATELEDRFSASLRFGTAGIRGPMRAGPNGLNTATVRRTAAGLASVLPPGASIAVGFDGRHRSRAFARSCAAVLAGAGCRVGLLPEAVPTPLLAFAVRHRCLAAGVMITASHNPARDNGLKVYLGAEPGRPENGAQLVPPADSQVEDAIGRVAAAAALTDGEPGELDLAALAEDYLDAVLAGVPVHPAAARELRVAYTPMHGVGAALLHAAFARAGLPAPVVVTAQAEPDPDFPTVPFPNPEEPGALDLLRRLVLDEKADLGIASDPDADRCAVVVPTSDGDARALTGDELGVLLGDATLAHRPAPVATTVVSSTMLAALAAAADVPCTVTLTGFKWLVRARPAPRFAYEEALGYAVLPDVVADKDGISAALAITARAAELRQRGATLLARLDELARAHGVHATDALSVRVSSAQAAEEVMTRLRERPPDELAGRSTTRFDDLRKPADGLPPADAVRLQLGDDARVVLRPSGTEPKLKAYLQVVVPVTADQPDGLTEARRTAAAALAALRDDVEALLRQVS
ncbi:MAG: phosphomannomutase [Frankiaceae bacterium]|nr:phosphomannomutase [Frankiaceae bacterium]